MSEYSMWTLCLLLRSSFTCFVFFLLFYFIHIFCWVLSYAWKAATIFFFSLTWYAFFDRARSLAYWLWASNDLYIDGYEKEKKEERKKKTSKRKHELNKFMLIRTTNNIKMQRRKKEKRRKKKKWKTWTNSD